MIGKNQATLRSLGTGCDHTHMYTYNCSLYICNYTYKTILQVYIYMYTYIHVYNNITECTNHVYSPSANRSQPSRPSRRSPVIVRSSCEAQSWSKSWSSWDSHGSLKHAWLMWMETTTIPLYTWACMYVCIYIYKYIEPGRGCPGKCVWTPQGQCFMHFGMSAEWPNVWRDFFPKRKTLNPKS